MNKLVGDMVLSIRDLLGPTEYSLHEPQFDKNEIKYLSDCLKSTYVSSVGPFVEEFEKAIAKYTGAKYAIATTNGTAALHLSLRVAGVSSDNEVLVPSGTFVASANAISYVNAHPNFIDTSEVNLGIDVQKMSDYLAKTATYKNGKCINKSTKRQIKAVMPVHLFGLAGEMDDIKQIAQNYDLKVIEDASEALGSTFADKHLGTIGDLGVLSFNGNKIITTGGGGMILTNNKSFAEACKHLSTTAKISGTFSSQHDKVGFNYRLPNLNAALGLAQLQKLEGYLKKNKELNLLYSKALEPFEDCCVYSAQPNTTSNYWLQTVRINTKSKNLQKKFVEVMMETGYSCRPLWKPIHMLKPYKNCPRSDLSTVNKLSHQIVSLPSGPKINIEVKNGN